MKPELYFGYMVMHKENLPILMAEKEKTLLDYLYFNSRIKTVKDMESLRLNYSELKDKVDWEKFEKYTLVFKSKTLDRRIKSLKKLVHHADAT
jgi:hypothetical protein